MNRAFSAPNGLGGDEPRALPWAGMKDAFGVPITPGITDPIHPRLAALPQHELSVPAKYFAQGQRHAVLDGLQLAIDLSVFAVRRSRLACVQLHKLVRDL